ncbi:MAG: curli-like amyloid fiber formation chaperone CsgH [Roseiarcus sp.]
MAPVDQAPPIVCSIIQQEIGDRVQLRGRLMSRDEAQGRYSLRIVKTGPSGSSTISQGGPFSAPANTETLVGLASFNLEPGGRFTAQMSLRVGDRTVLCAQPSGGSQ